MQNQGNKYFWLLDYKNNDQWQKLRNKGEIDKTIDFLFMSKKNPFNYTWSELKKSMTHLIKTKGTGNFNQPYL